MTISAARRTALVLAGHGSHISPNTAGLVWQHVDALRALGVADEVTAAFSKEMPSFRGVLRTLTTDDVTIVPLFTARGYFTQTVIPAEMALDGPLTHHADRTLRYARPLSDHPYLARAVRSRVEAAIAEANASPDQVAVAIIGHSTLRNPESRQATEAQAAMIRNSGLAAEVVAVYLDDMPSIEQVYTLTQAPFLIAVPYFLAFGSHATIDVPERLALAPGQTRGHVHNRRVIYTDPVGVGDGLRDVILGLARDAGMPDRVAHETESACGCFPAAGRDALIERVQSVGHLRFGQLELTPEWVQRADDPDPHETLTTPAALRAKIRETPFRPLATSRDLPGGWRVPIQRPDQLHAVVETVYPGAVADWAANRAGGLVVEPLEEMAIRQTGMYRDLLDLTADQCAEQVAQVCGGCVRHPTWFHGSSPIDMIPCAGPCNWWLSHAYKKMKVPL